MFEKFSASLVQKKPFIMAIKKALQTGTFNYVGQEAKAFPQQIWKVDQLKIQDQNWWECNPITKIDVSNNQINFIPDGILNLADLQVLRMKNNLAREIPACLAQFQNLKSIDLSRNKLQKIPEEIVKAPALVQLNVAQNLLQYCPNLDRINTLELIYINNNKLKAIPNLGSGIKKAEFQQNQIKQIFRENFQKCTNLQSLNLSKNHIQNIQNQSFNNSKCLVILEMKQNRLTAFSQLPNSQKLDTISLSFNRLTEFTHFDKCPNLTVLILSDNKIKNISKDIIKLKKLKTLDLSNNDLTDLPCEIGFINSLVRIQIQGNPLKTMRQNIRTGGTNVVKKYLQDRMQPNQRQKIQKSTATTFQKVNQNEHWTKILQQFTQNGEFIIKNMNITALDESTFDRNLRGINISDNKIKTISQNIYKLDQLKYIIINNNQIQYLPNSLQRLPTLQLIQAKNNQIQQFIITSPYGYPKLYHLDLSANKLKYIPKSILKIPKLRALYLSYNQIRDIQIIIQNPQCVPNLQILDVSSNQLSNITDNIFKRIKLNYLNIENNNLSKIPTVLGFMKLSGLKIDGNPLKLIKRTVIDKGTAAILEYLRDKHSGELPQIPENLLKEEKPQYVMKAQKPNYPYQTEHKLVKNMQNTQNYNNPKVNSNNNNNNADDIAKKNKIKQLQRQIKKIQDQLDNNMGLNTMQKNQKKKTMQSLMIQKNKLIKGDD